MPELEPCPFCAGSPVVLDIPVGGILFTAARCRDCGTIGPQFYADNSEAKNMATTLWNERKQDG